MPYFREGRLLGVMVVMIIGGISTMMYGYKIIVAQRPSKPFNGHLLLGLLATRPRLANVPNARSRKMV